MAVLGTSAAGCACFAGVMALIADSGCKCAAWTVAGHVLFGAGIGALVGAGLGLIGLVIFAGYECCYRKKDMKSDTQRVAEMVDVLMTIPDSQYIKHLDDLIADCHVVADQLPAYEDRTCLYCHEEGDNVIEPVRSRGCRGHHYMCKACWKEYLRTPRGRSAKCSVCDL